MNSLLSEIKNCNLCANELPLGPRPILQFHPKATLLITGQAPGREAHESNTPWNDLSGVRLREWLMISTDDFYDAKKTAIVPMGFCYPGRGHSGDLPPRKECSHRWMDTILVHLKHVRVKIIVGKHAADYFCGPGQLKMKIEAYAYNTEPVVVLPHPSPRNNIWLAKNLWFTQEALPAIRQKLNGLCLF